MIIIINGKKYDNKAQAITELAFCHYPVTVSVNGTEKKFASFDEAKSFIENS